MNRVWRQSIVIILIMIISMINNYSYVFANNNKETDLNFTCDFELSIEDLKNGVSVVMVKDDNGNINSYVCEDIAAIPMNCSVDDGSVELRQ